MTVISNTTSSKLCSNTALHGMIEQIDAIWRECLSLDLSPRSPRHLASAARQDQLVSDVCDLEWNVATAEVSTPQALVAKLRFLMDLPLGDQFGDDGVREIFEVLISDVERIAAA